MRRIFKTNKSGFFWWKTSHDGGICWIGYSYKTSLRLGIQSDILTNYISPSQVEKSGWSLAICLLRPPFWLSTFIQMGQVVSPRCIALWWVNVEEQENDLRHWPHFHCPPGNHHIKLDSAATAGDDSWSFPVTVEVICWDAEARQHPSHFAYEKKTQTGKSTS